MKVNIIIAVIVLLLQILLASCTSRDYINSFEEPTDIFIPEDLFTNHTIISSDYNDFSSATSPLLSDEIIDNTEQPLSETVDVFADISDNIELLEVNIDEQDNLVWIPTSGKKYHKTSDCSNMKSPSHVLLSEAMSLGYEPCKRCYKQ